MTDLLTRLEQATEGSRELDAHIRAEVEGWELDWPGAERRQDGMFVWCFTRHGKDNSLASMASCRLYTTSLDAALTLVPEGYAWQIKSVDDFFNAWVMRFVPTDNEGSAATPALALCIAALKARK